MFTGLPYQGNPEPSGGAVAARIGSGKATAPYVASPGTAFGRSGRVYVSADDDGIWVGGGTITCVTGI